MLEQNRSYIENQQKHNYKVLLLEPKRQKKRTTKKPLRELETDKWHGDGVEVTARGSNSCANEE